MVRKPAPVEHRHRHRYTIARMRRWSEIAERVAATTKTSEKTAILAAYLATLDARRAAGRGGVPHRPSVPRDGPADDRHRLGRDQRGGPARGGRRRRRARAARTTGRATSRLAVAAVLEEAGHAPPPDGEPTLPRRATRSRRSRRPGRRGQGRAARGAAAPCRAADRGRDRQGACRASSASGSARGSSRRRWPRRSTGRSTRSSGPGMLTGDIGLTAVLAREDRLGDAAMTLFHPLKFMLASPAEDAAEIVAPARADRLGRGQVRRDPGPAPPARRRGPALLARPARHQRPVPRGRRGRARPAVGRDPRRRDPRLEGRRRAALPPAPGAARAQEPVGEDPRGDPGDLRRVGRARAWTATRTRSSRRCSSGR